MKEIYGDHALYFHFSAYIDRLDGVLLTHRMMQLAEKVSRAFNS